MNVATVIAIGVNADDKREQSLAKTQVMLMKVEEVRAALPEDS